MVFEIQGYAYQLVALCPLTHFIANIVRVLLDEYFSPTTIWLLGYAFKQSALILQNAG